MTNLIIHREIKELKAAKKKAKKEADMIDSINSKVEQKVIYLNEKRVEKNFEFESNRLQQLKSVEESIRNL